MITNELKRFKTDKMTLITICTHINNLCTFTKNPFTDNVAQNTENRILFGHTENAIKHLLAAKLYYDIYDIYDDEDEEGREEYGDDEDGEEYGDHEDAEVCTLLNKALKNVLYQRLGNTEKVKNLKNVTKVQTDQ